MNIHLNTQTHTLSKCSFKESTSVLKYGFSEFHVKIHGSVCHLLLESFIGSFILSHRLSFFKWTWKWSGSWLRGEHGIVDYRVNVNAILWTILTRFVSIICFPTNHITLQIRFVLFHVVSLRSHLALIPNSRAWCCLQDHVQIEGKTGSVQEHRGWLVKRQTNKQARLESVIWNTKQVLRKVGRVQKTKGRQADTVAKSSWKHPCWPARQQ